MPEPGEALSEREMEVVRLVATGATNQQIARELAISLNTVKTHLRNIFAKLGVASRTEATLHAVREGWVVLDLAAEEPEGAEEPSDELDAPASETPAEAMVRPVALPWLRWVALAAILVLMVLFVLTLTDWPQRWFSSPSPSAAGLAEASPTPVQRWTLHQDMPSPRSNLALVSFEAQFYAIGGDGPAGVSAAVERFDPLDDAWTPLASKPTAVADIQGGVLGGRIYVPGGRDAEGQPTDVTEVYEVDRNRWMSTARLPRPLSGYALVAFEGHLYLFGGWDGAVYRDEILRYDPLGDRWEEEGRLPFPWGFAGAVVANNRIFLLGGVNADGPIDVILDYSPSFGPRNTIPLPDISLGRARATALTGDYLYILAEPAPDVVELWQYSVRTGRWVQIEGSAAGLFSQAAIAGIGSEIFLVGGVNGEAPIASTQAYLALFIVPIDLPQPVP